MVYKVEKSPSELAFDLRNFAWVHGKRDIFQPGKRSLEKIANAALDASLDGIAISRCYDDRFEYLRDTAKDLPVGMKAVSLDGFSQLGNRVYKVISNYKVIYIMRGQMTPTRDVINSAVVKSHPYALGYKGNIPNNLPLEETLADMRAKKGLITLVHPFTEPFLGVGTEILPTEFLERARPYLVYLEQDSSILGDNNSRVYQYAFTHRIPIIAVSNAHSLRQFGISYIKFNKNLLDAKNEDTFFSSLVEIIRLGRFRNHFRQSPRSILAWHYFILACHTAACITRRDKSQK